MPALCWATRSRETHANMGEKKSLQSEWVGVGERGSEESSLRRWHHSWV